MSKSIPCVQWGKTFLPQLEEGIEGIRTGEKRDVHVTFPKDYAAELAGRSGTFHVTAKQVFALEVPPVDEAFAQEYFECDMATLRAGVKESILQDKMDRRRHQLEEQVLTLTQEQDHKMTMTALLMLNSKRKNRFESKLAVD